MKIVHIAPNASFTSGLGYQENLLLKYQSKLGNDVTLIVRNMSRPDGLLREVPCDDTICQEGFRVIRKKRKEFMSKRLEALFSYIEVYDNLRQIKPDIVFFHGFVSLSILDVIKYKKNDNTELYIIQDNHEDYNIGSNPKDSIIQKLKCDFYKAVHKKAKKYINQIYGVTPWRTIYAQKVFGADVDKCDTLIMGADDELMELSMKQDYKGQLRKDYRIDPWCCVIVTGGKIDRKKRIIPLMRACKDIVDVHLIVFGTVHDDIKAEFNEVLKKANNITYLGWMDNPSIYRLFMGADLIVFPGQHSVLWEQACAAKTPCLFGRWEGMEHVNNGGNCGFMDDVSLNGIKETIKSLIFSDKYKKMKEIAESECTDVFLYSNIAQKSMDDYYNKKRQG